MDPKAHGFGKKNFWYHSHHDLPREFEDLTKRQRFEEPWVFISTPSLLADPGVLAPEDGFSLVALTFVDYDHWKRLEAQGGGAYEAAVRKMTDVMYGILEQHFAPGIRQHVAVEHVESPREVEAKLAPPRCAVYGAELTPATYSIRRVSQRSGLRNLDFVGATSCYPGIMPIIVGSMGLVDRLLQGQSVKTTNAPKKPVKSRAAS
jgi:phytoene dehydrogenase-like protein